MKIFASKKGGWQESVLKPLIQLVLIIAFVFIPLSTYINNVGDSEEYNKKVLAIDMALLMNALYTGQGNIYVDYAQNTSAYFINVSKNKIVVFEPDDPKILATYMLASAFFQPEANIKLESQLIKPRNNKTQPTLEKTDQLILSGHLGDVEYKDLFSCPDIKVERKGNIIIDPGHGGSEKGSARGNIRESELTRLIAQLVGYPATRDLHQEDTVQMYERLELIDENADLVVSIHVGNTMENFVKAYIPVNSKLKESRKIACLITNELLLDKRLEITDGSIIPLYQDDLVNDFEILSKETAGVLIEAGTVQKDINVVEFTNSVARAIKKSIEEYYE